MCTISMYCKTISDKMLEDGAPIANPSFWLIILLLLGKGKVRGTVHPISGHEDPEGDQRYRSTLSLTSALDGVNATPRPLYPRERDAVPIVQEAG